MISETKRLGIMLVSNAKNRPFYKYICDQTDGNEST